MARRSARRPRRHVRLPPCPPRAVRHPRRWRGGFGAPGSGRGAVRTREHRRALQELAGATHREAHGQLDHRPGEPAEDQNDPRIAPHVARYGHLAVLASAGARGGAGLRSRGIELRRDRTSGVCAGASIRPARTSARVLKAYRCHGAARGGLRAAPPAVDRHRERIPQAHLGERRAQPSRALRRGGEAARSQPAGRPIAGSPHAKAGVKCTFRLLGHGSAHGRAGYACPPVRRFRNAKN